MNKKIKILPFHEVTGFSRWATATLCRIQSHYCIYLKTGQHFGLGSNSHYLLISMHIKVH